MSGVTIGDGSIIATNSHVAKDVSPYSVVKGNPAQFTKLRFEQHIIDELLKVKWWNWEIEEILKFKKILNSTDVEHFLSKVFDLGSRS